MRCVFWRHVCGSVNRTRRLHALPELGEPSLPSLRYFLDTTPVDVTIICPLQTMCCYALRRHRERCGQERCTSETQGAGLRHDACCVVFSRVAILVPALEG